MNNLIEYAQRRLDEACRQDEDAATIRCIGWGIWTR